MERFVWIGPLRQPGSAGGEARAWCRTLLAAGAGVAAIDPDPAPPDADPPPPWLAPLFDGPALVRGATCVWQSAPAELRRTTGLFPAKAAARRVAVTRAPGKPGDDDLATLLGFDEIWVPTTLEREFLSAFGIPRERIHLLLPGINVESFAGRSPSAFAPWTCVAVVDPADLEGAAALAGAWSTVFRNSEGVALELLLPGGADVADCRAGLVSRLSAAVDWFDADRPPMALRLLPEGDAERAGLWRSAAVAAFPCRADATTWLREAAAAGTPVLSRDWAGIADLVTEDTAGLVPGTTEAWRAALRDAFDHPAAGAPRAVRAAALARIRETFDARGREVRSRASRPQRPALPVLDRVLPEVGLRTPAELISECRSRIVLCVFKPGSDIWKSPLRAHLHSHGPSDDVTFCLWADVQSTDGLEILAAEITTETEAHAGPSGLPDLQLLVAPSDHIPWDRVELVSASATAALAASSGEAPAS